MPIATPEVYADMLDRAKAGAFAYPAINITSSQTINAAIRGFAEAGSDGIIQVSTGGADFEDAEEFRLEVLAAHGSVDGAVAEGEREAKKLPRIGKAVAPLTREGGRVGVFIGHRDKPGEQLVDPGPGGDLVVGQLHFGERSAIDLKAGE